jgi:ATP-binding protein involved in chromosome partitioning
VSLGLVTEIVVAGKDVMFAIMSIRRRPGHWSRLRQAAERAVSGLPGIGKVMVALTAEKEGRTAPRRSSQLPGGAPKAPGGGRQVSIGGVPGVRHIIAVASGKGGVGKSTTAVNLALGLRDLGLKVGVLDADIYGPSMPRCSAIREKPQTVGGTRLKPHRALRAHRHVDRLPDRGGDADDLARADGHVGADQMLREVEWGALDVMVVDMPPGTGDAQLTMAQQVPLKGAVIVSTPQDLALIDARRGIAMFKRVNVPVLGIVENMSTFICPKCGDALRHFRPRRRAPEAERLKVPFLGEVPLDPEMRWRSDAGQPIVMSNPDSVHAAIFRDIAAKVWGAIAGETASARAAPRIVVE